MITLLVSLQVLGAGNQKP